jgi:hypothetical protein
VSGSRRRNDSRRHDFVAIFVRRRATIYAAALVQCLNTSCLSRIVALNSPAYRVLFLAIVLAHGFRRVLPP